MRLDHDISCAELVELVTRYFDGQLSDLDRQRFEEHVVFCDGCANHLHQMEHTVRVVGRLRESDVDDDVASALLDAFRGWKTG